MYLLSLTHCREKGNTVSSLSCSALAAGEVSGGTELAA